MSELYYFTTEDIYSLELKYDLKKLEKIVLNQILNNDDNKNKYTCKSWFNCTRIVISVYQNEKEPFVTLVLNESKSENNKTILCTTRIISDKENASQTINLIKVNKEMKKYSEEIYDDKFQKRLKK